MSTDIHGFIRRRSTDGFVATLDAALGPDGPSRALAYAVAGIGHLGYGAEMGGRVEPIGKNRGLPQTRHCDATPEGRETARFTGPVGVERLGRHSFTHVSVRELLDWCAAAPTVVVKGYLSAAAYLAWDKVMEPAGALHGIHELSATIIPMEEDPHLDAPWVDDTVYVAVRWRRNYADHVRGELDALSRLAEECAASPDDLELVVGFD